MRNVLFAPLILIILGGLTGSALRLIEQKPGRMADFSVIPMSLGDTYSGREYAIDEATEEILKASVSTNRVYSTPDGTVLQLFMAYFESQKYGSQIHSPKHCLPGSGWEFESIEPYELILPDGTRKTINYSVIRDKLRQAVMLYWYETRSGSVRNEFGLKFDLVKNSLLFNPTDAAIIRLVISCRSNNIDDEKSAGLKFMNDFYPYFKQSLPF